MLQSYGAGNAPEREDILKAFKAASDAGVLIINTTQVSLKMSATCTVHAPMRVSQVDKTLTTMTRTNQCHGGFVEAAYHAGQILLAAGVLPGGDMTPESALTKLSYVLANDSLDHAGKVQALLTNIRGERMVATEQEQFSFSDDTFVRSVARAMGTSSSAEIGMVRNALAPVLLCSAARNGDHEWITKLLEEGYDVNNVDYDMRTPLHLAAAE